MEETPLELLEPSPEVLLPGPLVEPWMLIVLGLVLLALLVMILLKRSRQSTAADPLAERIAAFEEARASLQRLEASDARSAAVQSSLILRKYLSIAARDPALYETHEEFISRHDALKELSADARTASTTGFATLASLKYAPEIPEADPDTVVAESKALLETLHQGFAS